MSPEIIKFIEWAAGAGPAVIFAYLWWSEREERRAQGVKLDSLIERCIKAINDGANGLGDLRVYLGLQRTDER